ncbi:MAG: N-acetylmuramic acid 6-phosphate etherase [Fimbriimonadales bacterium]|nr:N-acetylmuramic acid 6-phosphate etherase [Fimbriimonadales bacterium]
MRTEERHPDTAGLAAMATDDIVRKMSTEDEKAVEAVKAAIPDICVAAEMVAETYSSGGKVVYVGAGTSGRIAATDVSEISQCYGIEPGRFQVLIAGRAFMQSVSGAEDDTEAAHKDLNAALTSPVRIGEGVAVVQAQVDRLPADLVIGVSASGRTPYVVEAIRYAARRGAKTIGIANNPGAPLLHESEHSILLDTGPEVIAGATRLKAGTAQKMALNMISVAAMAKCGRIKDNLMTHLAPMNDKLRLRAIRIVMSQLGLDESAAKKRLEDASWNLPAALGS